MTDETQSQDSEEVLPGFKLKIDRFRDGSARGTITRADGIEIPVELPPPSPEDPNTD